MSTDQVLSTEQRNRVIMSMYRSTIKQQSEYLKFLLNENKIDEWWVMIEGMHGADNEFNHGQYLVRIELPLKFPYAPPHFYFMTHNGVYDVNVKVCVSIGEYHSNNYPSAQKVIGFVTNLVSGIIGWTDLGSGINIVKTDVATKRELARASAQYNQTHYADIVDKINKNFEAYSAEWDNVTTAVSTTTTTTNTTTIDPVPAAETKPQDATSVTRPGRTARPVRRGFGDV